MGTTIKELVYLVWRKLSDGDIIDDSKYTYRELRVYVESAIAEALKTNFYEHRGQDETKTGDDAITISYKAKMEKDEEGISFITLKARTVSVPGNRTLTIQAANPIAVSATKFIPMKAHEVFVASLQPQVPCVSFYYREGNKAYFINPPTRDKIVRVAQGYSIPDDDGMEIQMPVEFQNKVVQSVLQLLAPKITEPDNINNGVDES